MGLPSMKFLVNCSIFTGVAGLIGMLYVQKRSLNNIQESEFFREALKTLRAHRGFNSGGSNRFIVSSEFLSLSGAIDYLGEPIKQLGFKNGRTDNSLDATGAKLCVGVKGTKDTGNLSPSPHSKPFLCPQFHQRRHVFLGNG